MISAWIDRAARVLYVERYLEVGQVPPAAVEISLSPAVSPEVVSPRDLGANSSAGETADQALDRSGGRGELSNKPDEGEHQ
jgi:hypothetical protein